MMHTKYDVPVQIITEYKNQLWKLIDVELPKNLKKYVVYILDNLYEESLTISSAKNACYTNSKNLSSKFNLYLGTTPKKFIMIHRLNASKILLKKTDLTITEISLLIGFSSHSTFSKAFKNNVGEEIPSKWRRRERGKFRK